MTQYAVQGEGEEGEKHEAEKIEGQDQIETWIETCNSWYALASMINICKERRCTLSTFKIIHPNQYLEVRGIWMGRNRFRANLREMK